MAEKKIIKKKSKKPVKKTSAKPKAVAKRKPVSKKPAPKKTASKSRRTKPVSPKKVKVAPKKTSVKKTVKKTVGKTIKKTKAIATKKIQKPKKARVLQKPVIKSEEERKYDLKRLLLRRREEIVREAKEEISKYIKGETRQLVDTALDDGDWSVVDLSEDISLRQLSTHKENLQKIDEALRKLDEGTYGSCEDCGEEISSERLKIMPFAIYCIDCQERREEIEAMERREGIG